MAKLTKEQFDAQENRTYTQESDSNFRKRQNAVAKKVWDWQEKEEVYAWDAAELAKIGILLVEKALILERDGVQVQFYREPTPEGEADMCENEGVFGHYKLVNIRDGFYRIEYTQAKQKNHKE